MQIFFPAYSFIKKKKEKGERKNKRLNHGVVLGQDQGFFQLFYFELKCSLEIGLVQNRPGLGHYE